MKLASNTARNLLVGSAAAHHWWPEHRAPKDYDIYCSDKSLARELRSEGFDVQFATSNNGILAFIDAGGCGVVTIKGRKFTVASPLALLAIKKIHINYPHKWLQNMKDYLWLSMIVEDTGEYGGIIAARMHYLDRLTKIERGLDVPPSFWGMDIEARANTLRQEGLYKWCVYGRTAKIRRFVQDNYLALIEVMHEKTQTVKDAQRT